MAVYIGYEVALHEAAHAVAAHLLGLRVERVTIVPVPGELGSCRTSDGHPTAAGAGRPLSKSAARRQLVVALAGRAALHEQYPHEVAYSRDLDQAWQCARRIVGDDPAKAFQIAALLADCWERAQCLVTGFAQAIADLAKQLEFWRTIEGDTAERLVAAAVEENLTSTWEQAGPPARAALAKYGSKRRGSTR